MAVNCYDRALLGPTSSGGSRPAQAVLTLQRAALRHARQLVNHPSCHFEHYSGSRPVRGQHLRVAAAAAPAAPAAPATGTKSAVTGSWPCKSGELVRFAALPHFTCYCTRHLGAVKRPRLHHVCRQARQPAALVKQQPPSPGCRSRCCSAALLWAASSTRSLLCWIPATWSWARASPRAPLWSCTGALCSAGCCPPSSLCPALACPGSCPDAAVVHFHDASSGPGADLRAWSSADACHLRSRLGSVQGWHSPHSLFPFQLRVGALLTSCCRHLPPPPCHPQGRVPLLPTPVAAPTSGCARGQHAG